MVKFGSCKIIPVYILLFAKGDNSNSQHYSIFKPLYINVFIPKGDAVVDGSTLKWQYHRAFDGLTDAEVSELSVAEAKSLEAIAIEKNAVRVALELRNRIDGEPGPSGGYMKSYVTSAKGKYILKLSLINIIVQG